MFIGPQSLRFVLCSLSKQHEQRQGISQGEFIEQKNADPFRYILEGSHVVYVLWRKSAPPLAKVRLKHELDPQLACACPLNSGVFGILGQYIRIFGDAQGTLFPL